MADHGELHDELTDLLERVHFDSVDWPKAELEDEIHRLRARLAETGARWSRPR
jgi:hypothetical protein